MARYKYTSNKDPMDGTEEIRLPDREPVAKGGEIELSEEEHALLKQRLNLREVSDSDGQDEDVQEVEAQPVEESARADAPKSSRV
jgi:hypothetical protein